MNMNEIFGSSAGPKGLAGILAGAKQMVEQRGFSPSVAAQTKNLLSLESLDATAVGELQHAATSIKATLEGHVETCFPAGDIGGRTINASQIKAASLAGIMGGDVRGALAAPIQANVVANESMSVVDASETGIAARPALEAYDDSNTATTVAFSIAYNLAAARQDEFGEALFPTVVIPPDQPGMMMTIDLVMLQNDAKHQISGALENWQRYNVIRALTYPQLLQNDATDIIPVFRDESKSKFVDEAVMAPTSIAMSNGENIPTSALAFGVDVDILGLSQTDALLRAGVMDITDSVDVGVGLQDVFLMITDGTAKEVLRFGVSELPGSTFNNAVQGNTREVHLAFSTDFLLVDKTTKQFNGQAATLLAPVVSGEYEVRLGIDVSGKLNTQFGHTNLFTSKLKVVQVRHDGLNLDLTSGTGKTIADIFKDGVMVGYNLAAKRANLNKRQRGQLVDTTTFKQFYKVNLLAPVTVPRPHSAGDTNDARDLNALLYMTHVRTSTSAVDKLLATADVLSKIVGKQARAGDSIEVLGLARMLVDPQWESREYTAPAVVDGVKSHERAQDIQASLVLMIRDMANKMYQDSGYKPAADSQNGGMSAPPTVIIATDQYIASYLFTPGDLRTLGDRFPVKIVSTTNIKMRGKIFITFGDFTTAEAGVPNVMHFGTMQYRPELTTVIPTARDGGYSKEITVSPSYAHHVNLPILGYIKVTGINDIIDNKLPVNMKAV